MSRLNELIKELCPNGVEYKKLKDVSEMKRGSSLTKAKAIDGEIPVISGGRQPAFYCNTYNRDGETITVAGSGAGAGYVQYWNTQIFANDCFTVKSNELVITKYLYYYLTNIQDKISDTRKGGGVPHVHISDIENFSIPVPPLEVQREIVRILDSFILLIGELTVELKDRKLQYEYYRNKLLTFNRSEFQYKKLGDIFIFRNGLNKGKEFFGSGVPFIRYTDVYNHRMLREDNIEQYVECTPEEIKKLRVSRGDVLFTRTSETAEDIGWSSVMLDDVENCVFNGFTIKASPITDDLLPEYCAYCFSTNDFRKYVTAHCAYTTRASLTGNTIAEYKIAIPSHDVQRKIVYTLDNFERICNDLNIGLPAEIEARQKQYEYYRDALLTFAETGTIIAPASQPADYSGLIRLIHYIFGAGYVRLGDVAEYSSERIAANNVANDNYVGVDNILPNREGKKESSYVPKSGNLIKFSKRDTLIGNIRPYLKKIWFADCEGGTNGDVLVIHPKVDSLMPRYLYHILSSDDFFVYDMQNAKGAKMPRGNKQIIMNYQFALPTLQEQERIVSILDRFDTLCNDLTTGLPAEIEARQKQYEYFRDKLLTFKPLEK